MKELRYLSNVATLKLEPEDCLGCGVCAQVCPHSVYAITGKKARIVDQDGCMECGACMNNCPVGAISLTPGVGCAAYIIRYWIKGKERASCGSTVCN